METHERSTYDPVACGRHIRQLRKAQGLTQEQLAGALHISVVHLGKIETGKHGCSLETVIAIAAYFQISLDSLVFGTEDADANLKRELQNIICKLSALEQKL